MPELSILKQHQEANIWIAEQLDECVHKNAYLPWESGAVNKKCPDCKVCESLDSAKWLKPRSKDLGAMVNVADKLGCHISRFEIRYKVIVTLQPVEINLMTQDRTEIVEVRDHESPQHAAAWAIYLALREVKHE